MSHSHSTETCTEAEQMYQEIPWRLSDAKQKKKKSGGGRQTLGGFKWNSLIASEPFSGWRWYVPFHGMF